MNLRTDSDCQAFLDEEFAWRAKESHWLVKSVQGSRESRQRTLIRAGVPLIYAHWEGFIKSSAEGMLRFVSQRKQRYRELSPCFAVHGLASRLAVLVDSRKEYQRVAAFEFLVSGMDQFADFGWKGRVNTSGNLEFDRFRSIAAAVDIDISQYETRKKS